jgi:EPS-associated MarR family transcriptional regulator
MNEHLTKPNQPSIEKEEALFLLSELDKTPQITQREISLRLKISLGKTNYLINELIKKGVLKVRNFSYRPGKMGKVRYILTPSGFEEKLRLMSYFLKRKEDEYRYLKDEWERLQKIKGEPAGEEAKV